VASTFADGEVDPIPFFIQWSADSLHPSQDSPKGCELTGLEFGHARAEALRRALKQLGIDATVTQEKSAKLAASLNTPKGRVLLS
jgi:hypothetical protein